jgi:hypothetical protein
MKVDRKKFIEAVQYLREINRTPLTELDLSEFTDRDLTQDINEWKWIGLNNRDFVLELLDDDEVSSSV